MVTSKFASSQSFNLETIFQLWEIGLFLRDEIRIEYISFSVSLSSVRILAFFMRWLFRAGRLLSFFVKFCLILFFHIWGSNNWTHWKYIWLWRWYPSSAFVFFWIDKIHLLIGPRNWCFLWKFSKVNNRVIYNYMRAEP